MMKSEYKSGVCVLRPLNMNLYVLFAYQRGTKIWKMIEYDYVDKNALDDIEFLASCGRIRTRYSDLIVHPADVSHLPGQFGIHQRAKRFGSGPI